MTDSFDTALDSIARRVSAARGAARLSLDQLAVRSGVSKGTLVKLEQGLGNPSIAVLCQVSAALGISLADLVSQSVEQKMMEFDPDGGKVLWRGSSGGYARLIVGTSGADMVELWDWRLRPGDRYDAVAHSKGTREVIVVLRGRLGVSIGSSTASIASGRGLLATTDLAHSYWCEGARPVHFQMFVSERPDRGSL